MGKTVQIKVFGKVQGVFFRASTQREARALGLCGFVRNRPDGSVYIEAEGDTEQVEKLCRWCQTGPPLSRVERLEINEITTQNFKDFIIRRGV